MKTLKSVLLATALLLTCGSNISYAHQETKQQLATSDDVSVAGLTLSADPHTLVYVTDVSTPLYNYTVPVTVHSTAQAGDEYVYLITELQAVELTGQQWTESINFGPTQDCHGHWFISRGEVEDMTYQWAEDHDLLWVKELSTTETHCPAIQED